MGRRSYIEKGELMSTPTATNATKSLPLARTFLTGLCLGVLMWTQTSSAQVDRGSVSGTVSEATSGVLRGAKVTVRNVGTGQVTQVVTDDRGSYSARILIGGTYSITVEEAGFRTVQRDGVEVHVDQIGRAHGLNSSHLVISY